MSGCDDLEETLTSFESAIDTLIAAAQTTTQTEAVKTEKALNRILAHALVSDIDVPPLDNSAMDGYAIACSDALESGVTLAVSQRICAGETGAPLQPGTTARIFTGAPVPPGADAIIMQEMCDVNGNDITINEIAMTGQNIRRAGEDITKGKEILSSGTKLRAQELGLAASIGCSSLTAYRRVRVGVFFTGDELVEPGNKLRPGQIYDSNRYSMLGLLQTLGCDVIDLGIVADDLEATKQALISASHQTDLILTSGGVSVGEEDYVRIALQQLGELKMWRIAMKPGKPLAFGTINNTHFVGLPGNPVSAYVTFCLFVSPFIKKMQGASQIRPLPIPVRASFHRDQPGRRLEFLRARLSTDASGCTQAQLFPHQGSGVLTSTSWADGLVAIPIGTTVEAGATVQYYPFTEML